MSTCPGTGGAPAGIPIDAAAPERVIEQLQRLADRAVRGRRRGGHLIARIESTDGSWCWETAATGADAAATPVRPSTPFHLASLTKMYTAALVLRLAAHCRLALTDPVTAQLTPAAPHRMTAPIFTARGNRETNSPPACHPRRCHRPRQEARRGRPGRGNRDELMGTRRLVRPGGTAPQAPRVRHRIDQ